MKIFKCQCIKDPSIEGIKVNNIYKFQNYSNAKKVWIHEKSTTYEPFYCTVEYFNEYFKVIN